MKTLKFGRHAATATAIGAGAMLAIALGGVPAAYADKDHNKANKLSAELSGFNEVHFSAGNFLRGAISTQAKGKFRAKIDEKLGLINYELSYEGLEGDVRQSHIHFGQKHTPGGITIWLCQTAANPAPAGPIAVATPVCPQSGTVIGTIQAFQVLAPTGQGLGAGDLDAAIRAMRAGATYANVHSSLHAPGEIRGQIDIGKDND